MEELPGGPGDEANGRKGACEYVFALTPIRRRAGKLRRGADHFGLAVRTRRNWTRNFINIFSGRLPTLILLVAAPQSRLLRERYSQSDQLEQWSSG
ncbi:hypothetical protein HUS70_08625 [Pandoraea nosoerga]|uniref:hypothetical protein n=1 Tax=Pandoraea TaxID=93217 RepID=UPI0012411A40|nr:MULTISPECIES: hypothetical protein [Pandoraea]MBN4665680.1 hypothetical protein [Pandoraea nosoerga]MBN4675621.1 hypothetical protein [Pandoraea nosoerga]MBN4680996.1 hypothetical protein [Pandoraea nosoerga]MBN4744720.1 hypothetical protein [Pandoraea nosoerga]